MKGRAEKITLAVHFAMCNESIWQHFHFYVRIYAKEKQDIKLKKMHTISVFRDYFVHNPTRLRTAQYVAFSNIQDFWGDKHGRDHLCSFQDHWTGINNG